MPLGYLCLVLHAHLPYVRHPEYNDFLEEDWLYEAITESYAPLLLMMEGLVDDGVDFRLTFSLSPPLAAMLDDPLLQSRYVEALDRLIELADKEEARTRSDGRFHRLALMYRALFLRVRGAFVNRYQGNLLNGFRRFAGLGKLDLMTTAATHAYLPLMSVNETAVRAQIRVGVEQAQRFLAPRMRLLSGCRRIAP